MTLEKISMTLILVLFSCTAFAAIGKGHFGIEPNQEFTPVPQPIKDNSLHVALVICNNIYRVTLS